MQPKLHQTFLLQQYFTYYFTNTLIRKVLMLLYLFQSLTMLLCFGFISFCLIGHRSTHERQYPSGCISYIIHGVKKNCCV